MPATANVRLRGSNPGAKAGRVDLQDRRQAVVGDRPHSTRDDTDADDPPFGGQCHAVTVENGSPGRDDAVQLEGRDLGEVRVEDPGGPVHEPLALVEACLDERPV